jgi:hypothetical protein
MMNGQIWPFEDTVLLAAYIATRGGQLPTDDELPGLRDKLTVTRSTEAVRMEAWYIQIAMGHADPPKKAWYSSSTIRSVAQLFQAHEDEMLRLARDFELLREIRRPHAVLVSSGLEALT